MVNWLQDMDQQQKTVTSIKAEGTSLQEIATTLGVGYGTIRTRPKAASENPLPTLPSPESNSKNLRGDSGERQSDVCCSDLTGRF